ncbi:MAG: hypothetical protein JWO36_5176 [Myxococcales bacterium]|nr:hypothetical protein [Myxococcales bacterium]
MLTCLRMTPRLCLLFLFAGCGLYWNGADDTCNGAGVAQVPAQLQRNPDTGECQAVGGGGGCDTTCGPCPAVATLSLVPPADWASCVGNCEALDENTCFATSGCHAAYQLSQLGSEAKPAFIGCWEVAPSGPVQGSCQNLDAHECSRHDNCTSTYWQPQSNGEPTRFDMCAPEPTAAACAGVLCGAGQECVERTSGNNQSVSIECVAIATAGSCTGDVVCDIAVGPCPSGTTRGISNGCYTPYCIPNDECTLPACSTLTTVAACSARGDCDPVYDGYNCTCDLSGCVCQTQTFAHCQAR